MKKIKLIRTWWLETGDTILKQIVTLKLGFSLLLIVLPLLIIVCSQNGSEKLNELNVAGSNTLLFPLPPINQDWKTTINIVNLEDKRVDIKLSSNDANYEEGKSLVETSGVTSLEVGETKSIELEELLPESQSY